VRLRPKISSFIFLQVSQRLRGLIQKQQRIINDSSYLLNPIFTIPVREQAPVKEIAIVNE